MRGVLLFDRGPLMGWQRRRTVVLFGYEKVIFFSLVMVCSSLFCAGTDSHILLLSR